MFIRKALLIDNRHSLHSALILIHLDRSYIHTTAVLIAKLERYFRQQGFRVLYVTTPGEIHAQEFDFEDSNTFSVTGHRATTLCA
ncbi:hypothetical protein Tco_0097686 [Tanacetum coccineum]